MIHTVVFDVGNVLLGWDPRLLYRKLLPDEAANVIRAIGQKPVLPAGGPPVSKRGTVNVDRFTLATEFGGVFAGGDAVLGPATAVEAIAHGRRAAEAILPYLSAASR